MRLVPDGPGSSYFHSTLFLRPATPFPLLLQRFQYFSEALLLRDCYDFVEFQSISKRD